MSHPYEDEDDDNEEEIPDGMGDDDYVEEVPVPKILEVEDKIMMRYCELHGGLVDGMPVVRKQFEKLGIDFANPTKDELIKVVDELAKITENFQGEDAARKEKAEYMRWIRELD